MGKISQMAGKYFCNFDNLFVCFHVFPNRGFRHPTVESALKNINMLVMICKRPEMSSAEAKKSPSFY